jgi:hypothetical protein
MSDESMLRELFDRWERVWHEGQYDLVPDCVQPNYIRHDEAGDRTVTREAYAADRQGPGGAAEYTRRGYTITPSKVTARGFALRSSGLIPRPARRTAERACSPIGSRLASLLRRGWCCSH